MKKNMKALLMGSAAFACIGVASETAHAQSYAFGAGATFPQLVYRQLWDCAFSQVPGTGTVGLSGPNALNAACNQVGQAGQGGEIVYAPTGSGNGKASILSNNPATIGSPSASIASTDASLGASTPAGYDGIQFAGSDDIINSTDVANWHTASTKSASTTLSNQALFGNYIQIPGAIGVIGIGLNGKDGSGNPLTILPSTPVSPAGPSGQTVSGSSGLNLSRQALCGIFSGHITQWDNAILTALNTSTPGVAGTTAYGHGNITIVHRQDGSGSTFLTSNALATQCQFQFGPNSESDPTVVSYALPWTDATLPGTGATGNTCPFLPAQGSNSLNWPDMGTVSGSNHLDQCGNVIPRRGNFKNASGSSALVSLVSTTNGAIGYASADFWLPVKTGGLTTANIQSQWDISAGTNAFQPPSWIGGQLAMDTTVPFFDDTSRPQPLAWSLQGVNPNPGVKGAYPISGFTWLEMYQCYKVHSNGNNALQEFLTGLNFIYGNATYAYPIYNSNGFANIPYRWLVEIYALLNSSTYGVNYAGTGACASVSRGAY